MEELIEADDRISGFIDELQTCKFNLNEFNNIVSEIQNVIDELALHSFSNVDQWVKELDETLENTLSTRLATAIEAWSDTLTGKRKEYEDDASGEEQNDKILGLLKYNPKIKNITVVLKIVNQQLFCDPGIYRVFLLKCRRFWVI